VTERALLQRLNPSPQMTGCQVRIAERHLDIAMPGQRRHLGEWSSRLHQAADEGMPEGTQTHSGLLRPRFAQNPNFGWNTLK
jgi:hypothetical protein